MLSIPRFRLPLLNACKSLSLNWLQGRAPAGGVEFSASNPMKTAWHRFIAPVTAGARVVLLILTVAYVIALFGVFSHSYDLYSPLALSAPDFWHGKFWQIATYALLPAGIFDFLFNWVMILFLGTCLEKLWSRWRLWSYCLVSVIGAGLLKVLLGAAHPQLMVGTTPVVFGLLAAWGYLCANERVLLWFLWEMPVRQGAIILTIFSALLMLPCAGPITVLIMLFASVTVLVALWFEKAVLHAQRSRTVVSERMGRLEL